MIWSLLESHDLVIRKQEISIIFGTINLYEKRNYTRRNSEF